MYARSHYEICQPRCFIATPTVPTLREKTEFQLLTGGISQIGIPMNPFVLEKNTEFLHFGELVHSTASWTDEYGANKWPSLIHCIQASLKTSMNHELHVHDCEVVLAI